MNIDSTALIIVKPEQTAEYLQKVASGGTSMQQYNPHDDSAIDLTLAMEAEYNGATADGSGGAYYCTCRQFQDAWNEWTKRHDAPAADWALIENWAKETDPDILSVSDGGPADY